MTSPRRINLVVVGDSGVGKSSVVSAYALGAAAPQRPARVVPPWTFTGDADLASYAGGQAAPFGVRVLDQSNRPQDFNQVRKSLRTADVVVIVYDASQDVGMGEELATGEISAKGAEKRSTDNNDTDTSSDSSVPSGTPAGSFERVTQFWLPLIRRSRTLEDGDQGSSSGGDFRAPHTLGSVMLDVSEDGSRFYAVPIILVGNKIDQRTPQSQEPENAARHKAQLRKRLSAVAGTFPEVETLIECSASEFRHVDSIFEWSQKVVLFPRQPLFNAREGKMRKECIVALKRIFQLCDTDHDNLLSDRELNAFQQRCFNSPLPDESLHHIKSLIERHAKDGVQPGGITQEGFIFMHFTAVMKQKLEMLWNVLRCFGYGDDLRLMSHSLFPRCPSVKALKSSGLLTDSSKGADGADSSENRSRSWSVCTELSSSGVRFLTDLFRRFDVDKDGALSPEELNMIFEITPGMPWDKNVLIEVAVTDGAGNLTLQGWLALWEMLALTNSSKTLDFLAYLGYGDSGFASESGQPVDFVSSPLTVGICGGSRNPKIDRQHCAQLLRKELRNHIRGDEFDGSVAAPEEVQVVMPIDRTVICAVVVGSSKRYKSLFVNGLVGKQFDEDFVPTSLAKTVCNMVDPDGKRDPDSRDTYLVLKDLGDAERNLFADDKPDLKHCDIAVVFFDSSDPDSLVYAKESHAKLSKRGIPCMFFATPRTSSNGVLAEAEKYVREKNLPPIRMLTLDTRFADETAISDLSRLHSAVIEEYFDRSSSLGGWTSVLAGVLVAAAVVGGVVWAVKGLPRPPLRD